jgi:hypothetical protein
VRALIPYQAPDVSPFERPLTDRELGAFAQGFAQMRSRAFSLPFISVAQFVPWLRDRMAPLYRLDSYFLKRLPRLATYAGIRVIELTR